VPSRVALRFAPQPSTTGAKLDPVHAGEFLVHGIVGGVRTPVAGWNLLAAGSWERWANGKRAAQGVTPHPIHEEPSREANPTRRWHVGWRERSRAVTSEYDAALLPLTGGIDSRLLLAALVHENIPTDCYTHGTPGCADDVTVQAYRNRLPLQHRFHAITPDQPAGFRNRIEKVLQPLAPDYDFLPTRTC
jgi:hypothetical protein